MSVRSVRPQGLCPPGEVKAYLEELEHASQDMEGHARRASQRVVELERDPAAARATEKTSPDNAMPAVFDVEDRVIDRASRLAKEIGDQSDQTASSMLAKAAAARGREHELESRISRLEQDLVKTRADSE